MPRNTEDPTTPAAPAAQPTAGDPLLRLEYETAPPSGPETTRGLQCPRAMDLRGMPVYCTKCRAQRDWLLTNYRQHVWIHCRCGHKWLEPEITRADFDAMITDPNWTHYPTVREGEIALGFDGSFAGIYLE